MALLAAAALLLEQRASAQSLSQQAATKQAELSEVEQREGVLTSEIASMRQRIDRLAAEVAQLRNREAVVQADLDRVQAELNREQRRLEILQARLKRAIEILEARLIDIYKSSEPDLVTVLLEADGFADLLERAEYLRRIENMDSAVVTRVRELRNETRETVERVRTARDRIATKRRELAQTRSALEQRSAALDSARRKQSATLARVQDQRQELEGDLSRISEQIAQQLGSGSPLPAGPVRPGSSGMIWPVNGPVSSGFGWRWGRMHEGIDIAVPSGTPIRAALGGRIVMAGPTGGYGNYTCIDHGGGLATCYAHQSSFRRTSGGVRQAEVIGYVGCTGHCFGDHLHFEVRVNGRAVDPLGYL